MLNDIAVIKLKRDLDLDHAVQLACLPREIDLNEPRLGRPVWAVGWGNLTLMWRNRNVQFNGQLSVFDMTACQDVRPQFPKDSASQFCAGGYNVSTIFQACHSINAAN
jgi:hypothetical protein